MAAPYSTSTCSYSTLREEIEASTHGFFAGLTRLGKKEQSREGPTEVLESFNGMLAI